MANNWKECLLVTQRKKTNYLFPNIPVKMIF